MTHAELCKRAVRWLRKSRNCGVVLSEMKTLTTEIPDAIGWRNDRSFVVECKTSRADFLADSKKPHKIAGRGVGNYRYFMCEEGVIRESDLVGRDEGLVVIAYDGRAVECRLPGRREPCLEDERTMLVSALRRIQAKEFIVIVQEEGVENG